MNGNYFFLSAVFFYQINIKKIQDSFLKIKQKLNLENKVRLG